MPRSRRCVGVQIRVVMDSRDVLGTRESRLARRTFRMAKPARLAPRVGAYSVRDTPSREKPQMSRDQKVEARGKRREEPRLWSRSPVVVGDGGDSVTAVVGLVRGMAIWIDHPAAALVSPEMRRVYAARSCKTA